MKLSVIVPAYNEESRIGETLERIARYLDSRKTARRGFDYEIIVVDDGSTDRTAESVRSMMRARAEIRLISYRRNMGKGFALKRGMLAATGDLVLLCDADLATPIEEFERLLPWVFSYDIVIGSRALPGALIAPRQPRWRELAGKTGNLIVRALAVRGIRDTQCSFKLLKGRAARALAKKARISGFGFDIELLFLAQRAGLKIKELPVRWSAVPGSKVRIWHFPKVLGELLLIRLNAMLGRYA